MQDKPHYLPSYRNPCFKDEEEEGGSTVVRCVPYFMIIGVAKCATTDLSTKLKLHPHVIMPAKRKDMEGHWFNRNRHGELIY